MTTRRNHRAQTIAVSCDDCGEEFEASTDDFRDAIDEFKRNGGAVRQECGEWMHFCEDCK